MIYFRDDDAPVHGMIDFITVHEILREAGLIHTVAIICRNLSRYPEFVDYIKSDTQYFDPQFHCLDHIDHTKNHDIVDEQFHEGVNEFRNAFDKLPTVWYPTWNLTDDYCEATALKYGMTTREKKFSFGQYLRKAGVIKEGVLNFHSWAKEERDILPDVIRIYKQLNPAA